MIKLKFNEMFSMYSFYYLFTVCRTRLKAEMSKHKNILLEKKKNQGFSFIQSGGYLLIKCPGLIMPSTDIRFIGLNSNLSKIEIMKVIIIILKKFMSKQNN